MKNFKLLFVALFTFMLALSATAQSRINTANHTPNPAFSGNSVTSLLNVNLFNSCEYYNGAQVYLNGNSLTVYLDFNQTSGWCTYAIIPTNINVPFGSLTAGNYSVNFFDWDTYAYISSYNFTVYNSSGGGWNSCSTPISLTCGNTYAGNNSNGRYSWTNYTTSTGASLFTNMTGPETIHELSLGATSNVTITLNGNWADLDLMVNNTCSNNGIIAWSGNSGNASEQIILNNLAPGTYRVIVDGWQGAISNYNLSLNCTTAGCGTPALSQVTVNNIGNTTALANCSTTGVSQFQFRYKIAGTASWTTLNQSASNSAWLTNLLACTNYELQCRVYCNNGWSNYSSSRTFQTLGCYDPCGNAINLYCGQSFYGNTFGLANNWSSYGCSTWNEGGGEQVFRITTSSWGNITATLSNMDFDGDVFILNACSNNACIAYGNSSATASNQPPGTYYIVVDGYAGSFGSYYLSVSCGTNPPPPGSSIDEPCGATTIYPNWTCDPTFLSNVGATTTNNPAPNYNCDGLGSTNDVWVKLQIPAGGQVRVTSMAGTMYDGVVAAYTGTSCNALTYIGCRDDNNDGTTMPAITITGAAGTWIWLRYWGYGGTTGTFSVCATFLTSGMQENDDIEFVLQNEDQPADRDEVAETKVETPAAELRVFPVPATDHITVEFDATETSTLYILDTNGKIVLSQNDLNQTEGLVKHPVDISTLPTGMYFVRIQSGETVLSSRFTKVQ